MQAAFDGLMFSPADILLPQGCDWQKWSVVAYDQYTSQPEYWQRVGEFVGNEPSTLRLILPESCLDGPNAETDIVEVNNNMSRYLRGGMFRTLEDTMVYVERRLSGGGVRRGLMCRLDLDQYDYEEDAPIRGAEEIFPDCIPVRVAVRKNAPIELPHAQIFADDRENCLMGYLNDHKWEMDPVYDFELMEGGGHISGWMLKKPHLEAVADLLRRISAGKRAAFAVGDGNHSLVTAKENYERQKRLVREGWDQLPARYALVELVDLYEQPLDLRPIHRLVVGVEPREILAALTGELPGAYYGRGEGHQLPYVHAGGEGVITVPKPAAAVAVRTLQNFLDRYLEHHRGRVEYIHDEAEARRLGSRPGSLAFLLPELDKDRFFADLLHDGVFPRKTFSVGRQADKRFYLEARRIR